MNEAETRAEHIDPVLKASGWGVALRHTRDRRGLRCPAALYKMLERRDPSQRAS